MNTPEQAPLCACGNKRERRGHHTRGVTFRPTCRACRYKGGKEQFSADMTAAAKAKRQKLMLAEAVCERCGFEPEIMAQIHLHHRDGDKRNNEMANLQFVCGNCHVWYHYKGLEISQA